MAGSTGTIERAGSPAKFKKRKPSACEDGPDAFALTVDEIRAEIEAKFGWKMSRTRVNQILKSARRKMADALAKAGFAPDDFYENQNHAAQANQSLEAAEGDALSGDPAALPGENQGR